MASSPIQSTPIVFQLTSGKYGFLSEAALKDYSGMRLGVDANNTFTINFTEGDNGFMFQLSLNIHGEFYL